MQTITIVHRHCQFFLGTPNLTIIDKKRLMEDVTAEENICTKNTDKVGAWEKIQKIQKILTDQLAKEASISSHQINEMRNIVSRLSKTLLYINILK